MQNLYIQCVIFSIISLIVVACSDNSLPVAEELDSATDTQTTTSQDSNNTTAADTQITENDSTNTTTDAPNITDAIITDIATPPLMSDALKNLYCGLDNETLVKSALRAGACLDISVAGVLDDAARGFVYGEMLRSGYGKATYGNCDFLVCLANAEGCEGAMRCEEARRGEVCEEGYGSRCDGDFLEVCDWVGEESRWVRVQDCGRMGAECRAEVCEGEDCYPFASCQGAVQTTVCDEYYYGSCDGDILRRCSRDGSGRVGTEVGIDCGELVVGGTCVETAVGGEAPGPTCTHLDRVCTNGFATGFACDEATGNIDVCLYGEIVTFNCVSEGYSGCVSGDFFGVRCVP